MRSNRGSSAQQLSLGVIDEPREGWWRCKGLFSPNYLTRHLTRSGHLPATEECQSLYCQIRALWIENVQGLRRRNEAYTRTKFLDPTLAHLGWYFIPEEHLPEGRTRKRPDYCLFADEATERRAAALDATDIFRASATVMEAKKALHPLDQVSQDETPGWFPSQQIQDYLSHAKDSGGRFFNWAVLSNGNEWRLYCEHAAPDAYFAFHLVDGDEFCPLEEFRLFYCLFRPDAFVPLERGRCLLDGLREESLSQQEQLETNLRRRIFNVLEELAEGYFNNSENRLATADLQKVYDASLIFLYRLLFILYAEGRGLLPAKAYGPHSNRRYREEFSLVRFIDRLRDRTQYNDDAFDGLYRELLRLFHLINGTQVAQNAALEVTRYNGGLFDASRHPEIEQWWIGERTLARVLRQLVFSQPPARGGNRQLVLATEETVDFSTLEVRQLGDIYEGLLGGFLEERPNHRLALVDDQGENHQSGIFYTPDWVVGYLVREALQPLIDEVRIRPDVQAAMNAQSTERKQDNSFARAVLGLRVVDPAMGSGHFLVRSTEWLAEQIVYDPTTRLQTEKIVATGATQRTREDIVAAGRAPVSPGVSQEDAEIAYWRRRVVESCIYGVDTNPLAVELAKLSLWLTCIAVDEPLSFLDHHLRVGNSLIGVHPEEAGRPPLGAGEDQSQLTVQVGAALATTLREVIDANMRIETEASTEMEIVKRKERMWRDVRGRLLPFIDVLDLWLAAFDGLQIDSADLNALDYRQMVLDVISPSELDRNERRRARELWEHVRSEVTAKKASLTPFHWELEFPAVFYTAAGVPKPEGERGFDAVLGNPPYVSTQTSSGEIWSGLLGKRCGYMDDLYVHFSRLGLDLLRNGGAFAFIVSDTFFTLTTKGRMRDWLQACRLTHIGQCDPFDATVDAAIFIVRKQAAEDTDRVLFVQARYGNQESKPERELPALPPVAAMEYDTSAEELGVKHGAQGCLRLHSVPMEVYRKALKNAFFEPRPAVMELYHRFNEPVKALVGTWWSRIETSKKFAQNRDAIRAYQTLLRPGDITLVGLIAEGGQGMRTADNARFLGYLAGTRQAEGIARKREEWSHRWLADERIAPVFSRLLTENGANAMQPTSNVAAWEATVQSMCEDATLKRTLGLGTTDLYRVVPLELVATENDFDYAWRKRKGELLTRWRTEPEFNGFWQQSALGGVHDERERLRSSDDISDADFCFLCGELREWIALENLRRGRARPKLRPIPGSAMGLRSSEDYADPADVQRIAVIYNGLSGRGLWIPFRKGDPDGNRWADNEPLYVRWGSENVAWLFGNSGRSAANMPVIRNAHLYLTPGVAYTLLGNHAPLKARIQEPCVFDASASRLTSVAEQVPSDCLLALFNSAVFSYYLKKLLKNTAAFEISDLRMMPLVIPTPAQVTRLSQLAERAMEAKRLTFAGNAPSNELADYARTLGEDLTANAPVYLRPGAQLRLVSTASSCLETIELGVDWEAEKLYGVEGLGPFDEF